MKMHGWEYMIEKFRAKEGILTTFDMISDIHTAAEYRRILCDLRRKGFNIISEKATPKMWIYRLIETEQNGQMRFVA